jgi:heptose-I-phosphate ethanolaminephosphotransferase
MSRLLKNYYRGGIWSVCFALSFLSFFYLAMLRSVDGYIWEFPYALMNLLFFALLAFNALAAPGPSRLYVLFCFLVIWIPTVVVASYIQIYKSPFNFNTFYFIWGTNQAETEEFLLECFRRLPSLPAWVALYALVPLPALWGMEKGAREIKKAPLKQRCGVLAVSLTLFALFAFCSNVLLFNYAFRFYYAYARYQGDRNFVVNRSDANKTRIWKEDILPATAVGVKETYVVIIGESASRHHWGTYGYSRPTTPFLQKRLSKNEVFCFNNVISTSVGTMHSLLRALSFLDQNSDMRNYSYSIVDIFNGAGFGTYWFSNNAVLGASDTLLQILSQNAFCRRFSKPQDGDLRSMWKDLVTEEPSSFKRQNNLQYDAVLLPWLEAALNDTKRKKIVFLHLKGSHLVYQYRYPPSFGDFFDDNSGIGSADLRLQPEKVEIINHYDNSIRYTDFIVDEVIKRVEAEGGRSWVLYFSDHGEDVYDYNDIYGRDLEKINKYMLDVPFVVWFSEEYKSSQDVRLMETYLDRPYRLDDTIHSIIDIAGVKTRFFDASRSIFSPSYLMRVRGAMGTGYLDYPPPDLVNPRTVEQERELARQYLQGIGDL